MGTPRPNQPTRTFSAVAKALHLNYQGAGWYAVEADWLWHAATDAQMEVGEQAWIYPTPLLKVGPFDGRMQAATWWEQHQADWREHAEDAYPTATEWRPRPRGLSRELRNPCPAWAL